MRLDEAVKGLAALAVYFPRADWSQPTIRGWAQELLGFEPEDLGAAIIGLARSKVHPPALAEVIEACDDALSQRRHQEFLAWRERQPKLEVIHGAKNVLSPEEGLAKVREALESVGRSMEGA